MSTSGVTTRGRDRPVGVLDRVGGPIRKPLRLALSGVPLAALGCSLALAVATGLPSSAVARELVAVLLTQLGPGVVIWRAIRPRRGWLVEDLTLGLAVGAALAVPAQVLAGTLGARWPAVIGGPLVAIALMAVPGARRRVLEARCERLPLLWAPLSGAVVILLARELWAFFHLVPLTWPTGFRQTYVDMPYQLALAGELAHRGPGATPFLTGEPLHYHYFSSAWVAQVAVVSGTGLDQVLVRFLPALIIVVLPMAVAAAAVRVTAEPWAGPLAGFLAMAGGSLDVFALPDPLLPVRHVSPSLGLSALFLVALLALLAARWQGQGVARVGSVLLLGGLAFVASGTKGSATPVLVCGLLLAAVVVVVGRIDVRRMVLVDLAVTVASLLAAVVIVFRGATTGLTVSIDAATAVGFGELVAQTSPGSAGPAFTAAVAALVLVVFLARAAGTVAILAGRDGWRRPTGWLLIGTAAGGAGALVTLVQPGQSQVYFLLDSVPAMAIGSAAGFVVLARAAGRRAWPGPAVVGVVAGVGATLLPPRLVGRIAESTSGGLSIALESLLIAALVVVLASLLTAAATRARPRKRAAALCAAVAVVGASTLSAATHVLVWVRVPASVEVAPSTAVAFSADQVAAARWLRDHSGRFDVVATNRHCTSLAIRTCDPRRFFVSAYTERRVLIEGWGYTPTGYAKGVGRTGDYWNPALLHLNDDFLAAPTEQEARELTRRHVRWLFIDRTSPTAQDFTPYAVRRWDSRWARVYELRQG